MRQSRLFTKSGRNVPKDETALNAQLLIRAGYIHKEMAGVYSYLPLGLRVLNNIKQIVREEMEAIGGQELIMTALQRKEVWSATDRWDDKKVDVWFKSALKSGTEVGFGWSHEEPITDMMKHFIASYRDLPVYVYQFQTKLRNELRAKSGIMRGREFLMKDLYSYSRSEEEHATFYEAVTRAYMRVFVRVGLGESTFITFASGGAFTQFSHEFQTLSDIGEDVIYLDRTRKIAVNKEVLTPEVLKQLGLSREELEERNAVEVGNIFSFGATKSEQLGLVFKNKDGETKPVILGSYGIGITRLMGTIVELFADQKGIIWPEAITPFRVHLIELKGASGAKTYATLEKKGISVLYDETDRSAGEKFTDADLLGIPLRAVVSPKTKGKIELKRRDSDKVELVTEVELLKRLGVLQ